MLLQSITLKNYRSYELGGFEFSDGVTIIIGPNASGKTNLLEAVYLLTQGTSFRVSDKDLIRSGAAWARVDMVESNGKRVLKLREHQSRVQKTYEINDTTKSRLNFDQTLPVVLFEPEDIRIIGGSPERRRVYIDNLISHISKTYKAALGHYRRALKQRNALLKRQADPGLLFPWDIVLCRYATVLSEERHRVSATINDHLSAIYGAVSDTTDRIEVLYRPSVSVPQFATDFMKVLSRNLSKDYERGYTTAGPHRDDYLIKLNEHEAAVYASRGECRTITLALKVVEMDLVEAARELKPLLLLDDVFSELDGVRRGKLTEFVREHQGIITTTDADVVGKGFTSLAHIITL